MGCGLKTGVAATEAALDRRMANRSSGKGLELLGRRQFGSGLAAVGESKPVLATEFGHGSTGQNHRLRHQQTGRRWFDHLKLRLLVPGNDPALRLIQQQGPLGHPPTSAAQHQLLQLGQIVILGRGELNQILGVLIAEALGGADPAALKGAGADRALVIQHHRETPGCRALALAQAQWSRRQAQWQHRHRAGGEIKAGCAATGLEIQGAAWFNQAIGIGNVNPDPWSPLWIAIKADGVIDFPGVGVIDGDATLGGEVDAALIRWTRL